MKTTREKCGNNMIIYCVGLSKHKFYNFLTKAPHTFLCVITLGYMHVFPRCTNSLEIYKTGMIGIFNVP